MPRMQPAAVRKIIETEEQQIGHAKPRRQNSTGPAASSLESNRIETVDRPVNKEQLDMLAFAAMPITIRIHASVDPNPDDPIPVQNNGDEPRHYPGNTVSKWLYREKEYTIERRFVENLARAKVTTYKQRQDVDHLGVKHVVNIPHTALRYPFSVLHDPHPRGGDWLKAVLSEA